MPTPSFALEVQRGSIPGAPNATEVSGELISKRGGQDGFPRFCSPRFSRARPAWGTVESCPQRAARVSLRGMRIESLVDPMSQREPDATGHVIFRAHALFRTRGPARLDRWDAKRHKILRRTHAQALNELNRTASLRREITDDTDNNDRGRKSVEIFNVEGGRRYPHRVYSDHATSPVRDLAVRDLLAILFREADPILCLNRSRSRAFPSGGGPSFPCAT